MALQRCRAIPDGFSHVTEGQATILQKGNSVFYNKAQVVNRDVSMAVLRWFIEERTRSPCTPKRAQKPTVPADTMLKVRCYHADESMLPTSAGTKRTRPASLHMPACHVSAR